VLFALAIFFPFMNHAPIALLSIAFTIGSSVELQKMLEPTAGKVRSLVAMMLGALPSFAVYGARLAFTDASLATTWLAPIAIMAMAAFLVSAVSMALPAKTDTIPSTIQRASANALYLIYPGFLSTPIIVILGIPEGAGYILVWFALIAFGNDSLAWLAGVTLGRRRGIFAVSPNKSLEGLIAGIAGSLGFALSGPLLFPAYVPRDWFILTVLGLSCGVAVVLGDLFESAIKRSAGVKDSGSIVPGRGGILDSFDSLLFAAPVFAGILALAGILV
jgi:phosphatidate cytidylyltransferase